ncbi:exo-alpha-sialidase [Lentzea tibetensis]|uniref:Exo-alpha-sialidase n=1 Tax=Lentzea tibetensis TaxID=2591470 RepID=A0A563EGH3_9PSEU|nr:exo-alpha-sialidase [Lentzea tibetensis]TWP45436.1 exo-alpha-sialidase [Lentzea tibetensis]
MIIVCALLLCVASPASAAEVKALSGEESRYPHAIRLEHGRNAGDILVSVNKWTQTEIYRGNRHGRSFRRAAVFTDTLAATSFMCCAHLYELPSPVGDMPAGTVLWAGSVGTKEHGMEIRIWRSPDAGTTWSYLSTCASSANRGGIWEPEFSVDASGRLVCHFADESFGVSHSQVLARTVSADGVHWSAKEFTVALSPRGYRPGMAHVRRMPGGSYYMTYEVCGQRSQYFCEAYYRTSADGWNWGDRAAFGTQLHSREGRYFAHTPSIALAPNGTPAGRVVLIGQMLMHSSGKIDEANGARLFVNDNGGVGEWYEAPAPVAVPQARDVNCPNYHPALLTSLDGKSVLEFTSDFNAAGACVTQFASGALPAHP